MDFWKDKDMRYKKRMSDVYNEQVKDLMKVVPEFKVANAVIHYDETSPHMHIIGVPIKDDYKKGMKKQVAKSQIFTKGSLKVIQDEMRKCCIRRRVIRDRRRRRSNGRFINYSSNTCMSR